MRGLAAFLEREAGHVLLAFALLFVGAAFHKMQVPKAEDLILVAVGVMTTCMRAGRKEEQ